MIPLSPWQAWWDIMPWDTVSDFREQVFNGFGIVHKMQKRAAARSPRNSPVPPTKAASAASGGAGGMTAAAAGLA